MRRLAIAKWGDRVGTTLDFANQFLVVELWAGKVIRRREISLKSRAPGEVALLLARLKVTDVICGAISRLLFQNLETKGMQVIPFVSGHVAEVLLAFEKGALDEGSFLMAGCPPDARRNWRDPWFNH